jgi:hypothetical protein
MQSKGEGYKSLDDLYSERESVNVRATPLRNRVHVAYLSQISWKVVAIVTNWFLLAGYASCQTIIVASARIPVVDRIVDFSSSPPHTIAIRNFDFQKPSLPYWSLPSLPQATH